MANTYMNICVHWPTSDKSDTRFDEEIYSSYVQINITY